MAARTLENCVLVRRYGKPNQYDGVCEGFGKSGEDDEPCDICMRCRLHYLFDADNEVPND